MKTTDIENAIDLRKSSYIKVKKTGFFASLLIVLILVFIVGIGLWLNDKLEEARDWIAHTNQVQSTLSQVLLAIKVAETEQRGYLLTEDKNYLKSYTHSITILNKLLTTLKLLTLDNLNQQDRLNKVDSLIDKKLYEFDETIALIATQRDQSLANIVPSSMGQIIMVQLGVLTTEMVAEEASLLIVRQQTLEKTKTFVVCIEFIGFGILILVTIMSFLNIQRLLFGQLKVDEELAIANEEKDKRSNELLLAASVFTHALEGIVITDVNKTIIDVNNTFTKITGYSRAEAIGQTPRLAMGNIHPQEFFTAIWVIVNDTDQWTGEISSERKSGEKYVVSLTISAVRNAVNKVSHYVSLFSDVTEQRQHKYELEQMAHYDALTKLPNRALLADRLSQTMMQCQRQQQSIAVAFMDLDGFKYINDTYGHAVGDELLIIVSQRMKGALRKVDTLARIGGDEFVAVLTGLTPNKDYKQTLKRLLLAVSEPIEVGDVAIQMSVSIGVTLYPQDCSDADILVRHADQAMYLAKQAGKNRYYVFDSVQDDAVNTMQGSIDDIREALNRREFILYYQPKVNMSTGDVIGNEALIRWQHPERGLVPPLDFLPMIENHAISLDIGDWVIDTALSQLSQWQKMGLTFPISVNISAHQLQQVDFAERLATLLAEYPDVSAHLLELEVLETSAFSDIDHIIETMRSCIELGIQFSLDDFGTGYSSLIYLKRLPASLIKIDQSFIRDMLTDADDLAIVRGVISLAKAFRLDVIAEGVETTEHGISLLQMGCELAQGYGIARPMPASDFPAWLNEWKPHADWLL